MYWIPMNETFATFAILFRDEIKMCISFHPNLYERWDELCVDQVEYGGGRPEVDGVAGVPGARDAELTQVQHTVRL